MTQSNAQLAQTACDAKLAPKDISETLLELTGRALMTRDFALFSPNFHLPQTIHSPHGETLVENQKQLETTFFALSDHFKAARVTHLVRICEAAVAKTPTRVEATHVAHMLSGGNWIVAPFPVFSVLEYLNGRWRVTFSEYAVQANTSHARALHSAARHKPFAPASLRREDTPSP